jgi:hypothetical protein
MKKTIKTGVLMFAIFLTTASTSALGQSISNTRIDQLSHHTDERISPLRGNVSQIVQTCKTDFRGNYVLTYNRQAKLIEVEERTKEQKFYSKIKYQYDNVGRRTKGSSYSKTNSLRVFWEYKYDATPHPLEMYYDNKLYDTYSYDSTGNLIKVETKNHNQTVTTTVGDYTLNDAGQPSELKIYLEGKLVANCSYQYFENGDIMSYRKDKVNGNSGNEYYFRYEYDTKGNWIKRTVDLFYIDNNKPEEPKYIRTNEHTRTITYR